MLPKNKQLRLIFYFLATKISSNKKSSIIQAGNIWKNQPDPISSPKICYSIRTDIRRTLIYKYEHHNKDLNLDPIKRHVLW